jgi:hypothetical protein
MSDLSWKSEYGECQCAQVESPTGEVHALTIVPGYELESDQESGTGFSLVVTNLTRGREGQCIVRNGGFHFVRRAAEIYARMLRLLPSAAW